MKNEIIKKTLKNGVKLYLYKDENMKRTIVSYGVNYGSSGEYADFYYEDKHISVKPGCAHFLEHLLLEHSKYGNLYHKFAGKKYSKNGLTGMYMTYYYFIGVDDIKESLKELLVSIQEPVFTREDVLKTSEAIISETRMVRDNKQRVARAIVDRNFYEDLELVSDTLSFIGDEETTKSIDYEMLKTCYDAFYSDDNKVLLIGGNINVEEMTEYVESIYVSLPKHENRRREYKYNLGNIRNSRQIEYMSTEDDYVLVGFRNDMLKDFSLIEIIYYLDFIMDSKFSAGNEFVENLKKESVISSYIGWSSYVRDYGIHFYLNASCKDVDKFYNRIISKLKENDFSQNYFELYKKKTMANEAFKMDYKYSVLTNFVSRVDISENLSYVDFVKSMTFDRCMEFYNKLNFERNTTAIIRKK